MNTAEIAALLNKNVSLSTLIAGEDQTNNWLATANGANQYYYFKGLNVTAALGPDTTTFGTVNGSNGQVLGITGAPGDYLDKLVMAVFTSTQSRVTLQDVSAPSFTNTGTGTAFTSVTVCNFGTTTAFTNAQMIALLDQYLICSVTLTGVTGNVLIARQITGVAIGPGTTPNFNVILTLDTLTVNGIAATAIATTAGQAFISPLIQILPASTAVGTYDYYFHMKSKYGGWRLFTDSGVSVLATGKFT